MAANLKRKGFFSSWTLHLWMLETVTTLPTYSLRDCLQVTKHFGVAGLSSMKILDTILSLKKHGENWTKYMSSSVQDCFWCFDGIINISLPFRAKLPKELLLRPQQLLSMAFCVLFQQPWLLQIISLFFSVYSLLILVTLLKVGQNLSRSILFHFIICLNAGHIIVVWLWQAGFLGSHSMTGYEACSTGEISYLVL